MLAFLKGPLRDYSFGQRLVAGGLLGAAALGIPALILLLITIAGGRYQTSHGVEEDMVLTTAVYPLAAAIAGAVGLAFGPLVRRAWQAALLECVAAAPMFALLSLADEPHSAQPYHISWPLVVVCSVLVGGGAGVMIYRGDTPSGRRKKKRKHPRAAG